MGEGFMDVSVLLTFNKLRSMAKRAGLVGDDAEAMVSQLKSCRRHLYTKYHASTIPSVYPKYVLLQE